jgi:membrane-associated protease RseP (regulator of RpoE activity)
MRFPSPEYRDVGLSPRPLAEPRRDRRWKHAALLLLTFITTTTIGGCHYASFASDLGVRRVVMSPVELYLSGHWYSLAILAILGAHELGHYYACRYYRIDASLPYFIPAPWPLLTGTLGAFIRIRQPIPLKRQLFDVGIAGPIAGFVVAVPVLVIGLSLSRIVAIPPNMQGVELGEPLLFQGLAALMWGNPPDGYSINMHPMAFAAWFGLLATLLNLFPIGQLDGGHIAYAVFGRKSTIVSVGTVLGLVGLTFVSRSWLVWSVLTVGMLLVFGAHHPQTVDEDTPLDRGRILLALFAVVMFVLCFTPAPIEPLDLVARG